MSYEIHPETPPEGVLLERLARVEGEGGLTVKVKKVSAGVAKSLVFRSRLPDFSPIPGWRWKRPSSRETGVGTGSFTGLLLQPTLPAPRTSAMPRCLLDWRLR